MGLNSHHFGTIVYTENINKGKFKIEQLISERQEDIVKRLSTTYITDKNSYSIVKPSNRSRGLRYLECYIDKELDFEIVSQYILLYMLPSDTDWRQRV